MGWDWDKLKDQHEKRGDKPPQLDDFFKKMNKMKSPQGGQIFIVIIIIVGLLLLSSVFYTVAVDEVAVVQRFGKYIDTHYPGLNYRVPVIDKVTKVKVKRVYKEEFGTGATGSDVSLMLTGDLNVAVVPWIVQYRIKEPALYLFKVQNVNRLLQDMSEATMRLVVGDRSINEVISKREEIADEAKVMLQKEMEQAETGIDIVTIEMKRTNVPEPVQPSFNEVNQAVQEKEKLIYQAKEEYNKAIPAARGEAERTVKAAEGYALDRVNRGKGDAARFTAVYREYAKAKDITKRRLYLETMKELYPRLGQKYIIDSDQKNFLPLLNLETENKLIKSTTLP
ncbi:MAG: FtsH protease activity modulator HflK [Desulfobacteraceae bacterium]|nr:FtsH protease activity modulator HflK [Desulfobacteraceae bacterium]